MRRISVAIAVLLGAAMLVACKGDAKTTTFVFSPDAGATPGYVGGTPVTLTDGTPVTLESGAPVTTPVLKDKNGKPITTRQGASPGSPVTLANGTPVTLANGTPVTVPSSGSNTTSDSNNGTSSGTTTPGGGGGTTTTAFVNPTGTTVTTSKPDTFKLAFPKTGVYGFHETLAFDDGGTPTEQDTLYNLTSPDAHDQIKWQRWKSDGTPAEDEFYVESHDNDGLWLVDSQLIGGGGKCDWSPKAGELPQSIIDKIGQTVTTDSSCSATLNGTKTTFNLHTEVKSLDIETLNIGGKNYTTIRVERNRELEFGGNHYTTTAHDWYAFDLGLRVKVSDHTTLTDSDGTIQSSTVRDLVLTSLA